MIIQHTNLLEERVHFTLCAYCTPGQPSVMVYCACGKNLSGIAPCSRRVQGTKCSKNMCKLNKTVYYCSTFEDSALQIIYSIESFKCCQAEVFLTGMWKGSCKAKSLVKSNLERRFSIKMASHGDALLVRSSTVLFEVLPQMMSLLAIHRVKPNINPHGIWFLQVSNQF